jgi:hypothetical protein
VSGSSEGAGYRPLTLRNALLVVLLAATTVFHFAWLPLWRQSVDTTKLPNNGHAATLFTVYSDPFQVFAEDFHLYALRSKRILDRGFVGDLFAQGTTKKRNYSAPLQVVIGLLLLATGGHPVWYACLLYLVLAVAWSALLWVAWRVLPKHISRRVLLLSLLLAVSMPTYFQTGLLRGPVSPKEEMSDVQHTVWPEDRALRVSTLAWSGPLFVAYCLLAAESMEAPTRRKAAGMALLLSVFALADNWTFLLALFAMVMVAASIALRQRRCRDPEGWVSVFLLGAAMLVAVAAQQLLTSGMKGDATTRGGVGPAWHTPTGIFSVPLETLTTWGLDLLKPLLVVVVVTRFVEKEQWRFMGRTFGLILIATVLAVVATAVLGIEQYQQTQFLWRSNQTLFFLFCLLLGAAARQAAYRLRERMGEKGKLFSPTVLWVAPLIAFLLYGQVRTVLFLREQGLGYALPRDLEGLQDWTKTLPNQGKGLRIATLAPETNFLLAYWTDADLLLPSGFPYHDIESNEQITDRVAAVLRLYHVDANRIEHRFASHHPRDLWQWKKAPRDVCTRGGFEYFAFHRETQRPLVRPHTLWLAIKRRVEAQDFPDVPLPDYAIIDDTVRQEGHLDPRMWKPVFTSGTIVVVQRVSADPASKPARAAVPESGLPGSPRGISSRQ